ncbi:MAG: 4-hydroxy-3-methylbut-2-enyl diphosphate reductase [Treponemataceae bacterium]
MVVVKAKILGCCMGVKKALCAVEKAINSLSNNNKSTIYTFGPLIHNNQVLASLEEKKVAILTEADLEKDISPESIVVIRAHGIPPKIMRKIQEKNVTVINATCPHVLISQKKAESFPLEGRTVILVGDKNHGEIVGIAGFAEKNGIAGENSCIVIQNEIEAHHLKIYPKKAALLAQTTISHQEFESVSSILKEKIADLVICNTICSATNDRQAALDDLRGVDAILVIGGKNSANTKRLFTSALNICKNVALIETKEEIPYEFFLYERIGITAGASTPDFIINEIEDCLLSKKVD